MVSSGRDQLGIRVVATQDFQAALYTLYLLTENLVLSPEEGGELFAEFVKIAPPEDEGDDVYKDWVQKKLVPEVRATLIDWNLPIPQGILGQDQKPVSSWDEARWQDVLKRGLLGITFQDRIFSPTEVRLERINRVMKMQQPSSQRVGDFLFYLVYSFHLSILPDDLLQILPANFVSNHDFFVSNVWNNGGHNRVENDYTHTWNIAGTLFFLPSEIGHLFSSLIGISVENSGKEYQEFTNRFVEVEDRLGALAMQKRLPFLTFPEAQEFVLQITELGNLLARDQLLIEKALEWLKEILDGHYHANLRNLYRDGKIEEAVSTLTPSEIYYLGKAAFRDSETLLSSFPRSRLTIIKESLVRAGVWEVFQEEIDQTVGILARDTFGASQLRDIQLEPYWEYIYDSRTHRIAERHSVDFIVHLVRIMAQEQISPNIQPYLIIKAIRFLYENGDSTKSITENILKINRTLVRSWVAELLEEGLLREGIPIEGKERVPIPRIFQEKTPPNEIAFNSYPLVFFGILGFMGKRKRKEKEANEELLKYILSMTNKELIQTALDHLEHPENQIYSAARDTLVKRLMDMEIILHFSKEGLSPDFFEEFLSILKNKIQVLGINHEELALLNILPGIAESLMDQWLKVRDQTGLTNLSLSHPKHISA